VPAVIDEFAGVTLIDTSVGAVTVSVVEADRLPIATESVVEPMLAEVAKPEEPEALLIDATVGFVEDHATEPVRS